VEIVANMDFRPDALKATVQLAADAYKDNARIAAVLDDKAQKTGGLAGIFLAAAFGFVKPGNLASFLVDAGIYSGVLLVLTAASLLFCLCACLAVMWVRGAPQPLAPALMNDLNRDLMLLPAAEVTDQVQANYYRDVIQLWGRVLESQTRMNRTKGGRLLLAQVLLGIGMIIVAGLLFSLIQHAGNIVPKL
jgi:hypothetical protein